MKKFSLGQVVITANALKVLAKSEVDAAIARHINNDWGECCKDAWKNNDKAVKNGGDLLSIFTAKSDVRFFIKTEWDRSVTTVYLPWED